jgi:hypothetical protein
MLLSGMNNTYSCQHWQLFVSALESRYVQHFKTLEMEKYVNQEWHFFFLILVIDKQKLLNIPELS